MPDRDPDEDPYEYRVVGAFESGWWRTDWTSREEASDQYHEIWMEEDWVMIAVERRVNNDDSTLERCNDPVSGEWMPVTGDTLHFSDEKVVSP